MRSILSTVWHTWSCKCCRQVLHSRVLSCPAERPVNTNDHPVDLPTFFGRHFFPHNCLHYPVKIDPNIQQGTMWTHVSCGRGRFVSNCAHPEAYFRGNSWCCGQFHPRDSPFLCALATSLMLCFDPLLY